jgi:hypothetical protein
LKVLPLAASCAALAVAVAGCQSTQATSRQRQAEGVKVGQTKNITVNKVNDQIKVEDTTILSDQNGTAVVVTLKNESNQTFVDVPIQLKVQNAKGQTIFRNNIAGTQQSLVSLAVLEPHQTFDWVHDQILLAPGQAKKVQVTVGQSSQQAPPELPEIELGRPKTETDPVSGVEARGTIENKSDILQEDLTVYGVARQGGRIVAAGRSGFRKLPAGKKLFYDVFFIGNPQGADVQVAVEPNNLE